MDDGSYEKYGRFMWLDSIVKLYPSYTHDDVFFLEFEFVMMLLMLRRDDVDYSRRYDRESAKLRRTKK